MGAHHGLPFSKKKNEKHKLQAALKKCLLLDLYLLPQSQVSATQFRKVKWLPVFERVEFCIANNAFEY